MRLRRSSRYALSTCLTAIALAGAAAQAQAAADAASGKIEQVVVSAERRTTNIQDTAIAITAIDSSTLQKSNVTQLADINGMVPSVEITKQSGFETVVSIRGVGSETPENAPTTTPGVSLFIDGVYVANTISLDETLFDLDRMEILRGPQGVLYGQSSIGGAINLVTKQPSLDGLSGSANVSVGDYDLYRIQAELNVPLSDTMAMRVSAQKYSHRGFTRNLSFPNYYLDDADDISGKVAFLWQPTSNFKATLTEQYYRSGQNGAAQKNINDPSPNPRVLSQDYPSKFNLHTNLLHLNMDWDMGWATLKSVTAYQYLDHSQQEDGSRSTYALLGVYDDVAAWNTNLKSYTQELDLVSNDNGSFSWIAGVFGLYQKSKQFVVEFQGTDANPVLTVPPNIATTTPYPYNLAYGNITDVTKKSYSAFIQGTYKFLDNLSLTVGGRYNYDSYDLSSFNFFFFGASTAIHKSINHTPTFRGELDYNATPDNMLYASVSRGYKPGGVNGAGTRVVTPVEFKPETNTSFEIGSKNMFLDHTLRLNLAAFYYLYKNMQYIEVDPVPYQNGIANIPSVHVWGAELEASYVSPDSKLHIDGNLSLENGSVQGNYYTINSTIANAIENQPYPSPCAYGGAYYNPACWAQVVAAAENIGGNQPAKMPKVSGSLAVSYRFRVPMGELTPRVQFIHRGSFWARMFAEPALDKVPSYNLVNLNFQYVPDDSNFMVSLAVTNVGDEAGVNSRYTDPYGIGQTSQQFIPPRQVIGTVSYNF